MNVNLISVLSLRFLFGIAEVNTASHRSDFRAESISQAATHPIVTIPWVPLKLRQVKKRDWNKTHIVFFIVAMIILVSIGIAIVFLLFLFKKK